MSTQKATLQKEKTTLPRKILPDSQKSAVMNVFLSLQANRSVQPIELIDKLRANAPPSRASPSARSIVNVGFFFLFFLDQNMVVKS